MIADAATADPSAEGRLVASATDTSLAELRHEWVRTKASATPDLEARREQIHARGQPAGMDPHRGCLEPAGTP